MKIVVDATMVKGGQAGIRSYALGLTRSLAAQPDTDVTVLTSGSNDDDWGAAETVRTGLTRQDPYSRAAWRFARIPSLTARLGADALLVPAPEPVPLRGIPQGIVVHDLGPLLAPAVYGRRRQLRYAATLRTSVNRSGVVFTPSVSTKLDVMRWTGLHQCRIEVAGPALHPGPGNQPTELVTPPYALYVGAMLPHKNVDILVDCFSARTPDAPDLPSRLVIVGPDYTGEVRRSLQRSHVSRSVEHRGFVSHEELGRLYAGASVVVFPSLFEGFGLPLIEALAHGTPVVASDIPPLREVGDDRVTYVRDPTDPAEWRVSIAAASRRPRGAPGVISWTGAARLVREVLASLSPTASM